MADSPKKSLKLWVVDDRRHRRGPVAATKTPTDEESVGVFLRSMRERRHESLEQVARALRINHRYLKGIEEGRFEDLPGKTYAVGFVRSYAEYLRVDVESVLRHLRRELGAVHEQRELIFPEPLSEGGVPGAALIATSVFVAIVVYGVWYYQSVTTQPPYDLATPEPAVSAPALPPPARVTAIEPGAAVGRPEPADPNPLVPLVPPGVRSVPDASVAVASEPPPRPVVPVPRTPPRTSAAGEGEIAAGSADARPSPGASPPSTAPANDEPPMPPEPPALAAPRPVEPTVENQRVAELPPHMRVSRSGAAPALAAEVPIDGRFTGADASARRGAVAPPPGDRVAAARDDSGDRRIVLRAVQASWIEIRSRETGRIVVGRLLRSGETYEVPREAGLMLTTGNAGGLEVVVDGDVAPPLGPEGVILRNVTLDGDRLLAGTADR